LLAAGPDWGTVPDWLAAIGTLAAFGVALRLLAKELAARREQEEDRRSSQARLVSAWPTDPQVEGGRLRVTVVVKNGSDEPVYQVHAVLVPPDSPWAEDPEAGAGQVPAAEIGRMMLPPGQKEEGRFPMIMSILHTGIGPGPVGISFTDAAGRRWKRYPDGRLVELNRPLRRSRKDYMNAWIAGEVDQLDY
jgi:hypothetical protein